MIGFPLYLIRMWPVFKAQSFKKDKKKADFYLFVEIFLQFIPFYFRCFILVLYFFTNAFFLFFHLILL